MELKKLRCEMCGGNDLIKKDDFFECQNCGTKYSIEEIKKIIVERNIETNNNRTQVNSANIENYLNIAKSAYNANNMSECETYCNKILENDSNNYEAWLLKGKCVGWQSRIEEAGIYFSNTIDNTSEDKIDEIKSEIGKEIQEIIVAIIAYKCKQFLEPSSDHSCKQFLEYPSDNDKNLIIETEKIIKENFEELLLRCGVNDSEFRYSIFILICNVAMEKWNNEITSEYFNIQQHPAYYEWQLFFKRGEAVVYLIEKATLLLKEETPIPTIIYENLIGIYETIVYEDYKFISEDKLGKLEKETGRQLVSRESDYRRLDKIMEWHRKWNEIDSTHIIPKDK